MRARTRRISLKSERLAGHRSDGQAGHIREQLLKGSLADVASFGLLGVLATLMCRHQHLCLNRGIAHLGTLSPTVSDGERRGQAWVSEIRGNMQGSRGGRDRERRAAAGRVCAE